MAVYIGFGRFVCLSVCLFVCLYICPQLYLGNYWVDFHEVFRIGSGRPGHGPNKNSADFDLAQGHSDFFYYFFVCYLVLSLL